jgi:hypothetical protein
MSKEKKSKLDQFARQLLEMDDEKKTIAQMVDWLKAEGVTASTGLLGGEDGYLAKLRRSRLQDRLLAQITSGSDQCSQVEKAFAKNPAPELETIIKLHRVLILQLSTIGNANPEILKLSDQLTNTVINCISAQTKAAFKEREVTLAETKAAESKKTDQQKALEYCLAESKGTPAEEIFKSAFIALKKAKGK